MPVQTGVSSATRASVWSRRAWGLLSAQANSCVGFRDDKAGRPGVFIDADVLKVAAVSAISSALRRLGPRVLPWSEMVRAEPYPTTKPARPFCSGTGLQCGGG